MTYFRTISSFLFAVGLLILVASHNYLLFHVLAEFFSIIIACGIFMFAWASRRMLANDYLLFLGIAYLFIAGIDLIHTLTFKGMGILDVNESDVATQLWIAARYLESTTLLVAPLFLTRRMNPDLVFVGFGLVFTLIIGTIFFWEVFPSSYIEGQGLTQFKILSEYLICLMLLAAAAFLIYHRRKFEPDVLRLLIAAILLTAGAELTFTTYVSVYDWANFTGHLLKIFSFYLIYVAIIKTGLTRPYSLLFRDLKQSQDEERIAREELKVERDALLKSEERFRTLADNISQHAWMADAQGGVFWYNKRWYEYSGSSPAEMEGSGWRKVHHPDHIDRVTQKMAHCLATGEICEDTFPLKDRGGQYRWFLSRAVPIKDDMGRVRRWFGTLTDITELREAQQALKQTADRLARSNLELEQFAYVASHDLKAPLGMISGFLNLLARRYRGKLDAKADEYIQHAIAATERMQQLIQDALTLSQVETRGNPFKLIYVREPLTRALDNLRGEIEESRAEVTFAEMPMVPADGNQLVQLFQNLIGNAIKYRNPDQPPRIKITTREQEAEWEFLVGDNGVGFDPQHAKRIFQIFQRLHTSREYPGTGIGLAICKKIVEHHGGRIWVETEPGRGSSFFFTLPKA